MTTYSSLSSLLTCCSIVRTSIALSYHFGFLQSWRMGYSLSQILWCPSWWDWNFGSHDIRASSKGFNPSCSRKMFSASSLCYHGTCSWFHLWRLFCFSTLSNYLSTVALFPCPRNNNTCYLWAEIGIWRPITSLLHELCILTIGVYTTQNGVSRPCELVRPNSINIGETIHKIVVRLGHRRSGSVDSCHVERTV